jgi:F0F1-type ATP synthase membrane subunit b/b'
MFRGSARGGRKQGSLDEVARILALAQQTADQAIADAQSEAAQIIAQAHREAEQIIADARARPGGI